MRFVLGLAALLAAGTLSASALAQQQPWLSDRRFGEGIGIRTGSLELHPGIASELGYDSNYFQRAPEEDPIDLLRFRLTPSLSLSTLGERRRAEGGVGAPPSVNFRTGLALSYNELLSLESGANNRIADLVSAQRHLDAEADVKLDILPERPWGVDAFGRFRRSVEPSNSLLESRAFDRDSVNFGAGVNWRPGGGLFTWRWGYDLKLNLFERALFIGLDNNEHWLTTRGRWKFLPRTALLYGAEYGIVSYRVGETGQNGGQVLRSHVGINGLVTNHFAVLAVAGWAQSYYEAQKTAQRNYDDFVGRGELKWYILPKPSLDAKEATIGLSSIAAGFVRGFHNSYLGDFYRRDRGYLDFEYFVGGKALLKLEAGVDRNSYAAMFSPTSGAILQPSFAELRAGAMLFSEYRFSDSLAANATLRYDTNLSDESVRVETRNPAQADRLKFSRFQAWVGARWFM